MNPPKSVLFVCLGNICRSPSAESVMRKLSQNQGLNIAFDSAGTANYHTNEKPDVRAIKVGQSLGYDLTSLRARQVRADDFYQFDLILAMDESNLANLQKLQPTDGTARLELFDPTGQAVADPYYGDLTDFEQMFIHIEQVVNARLDAWR